MKKEESEMLAFIYTVTITSLIYLCDGETHKKGVNAMNYKILRKDEMHIIGFKKWFSTENDSQMTEIPKMWDSVTEEMKKKITELSNNKEENCAVLLKSY